MFQKQFFQNYDFLKKKVYFSDSDFDVGLKKVNSALFLGLLSGLAGKNCLFMGDYGLGKTKLSSSLAAMVSGVSEDNVLKDSLKGHPDLSLENIVGRPDLGALNKGVEKVIWSSFVKSSVKVVDEINRMRESTQNILLSGLQSGKWSYLNGCFSAEDSGVYATANYPDSGNNSLIPPLLDRFDIALECKRGGANIDRYMRHNSSRKVDVRSDVYSSDEFRDLFEKENDVTLFDEKDKHSFVKQISNQKYSEDANLFMDVFIAELGTCQVFGSKRAVDKCPSSCPYTDFSCYDVDGALSFRSSSAIDFFSKALSYLRESSEVLPRDIVQVAPYAIWHKSTFRSDLVRDSSDRIRGDPVNLAVAKNVVSSVYKRFDDIKGQQKSAINAILAEDVTGLEDILANSNHPVFREYLK